MAYIQKRSLKNQQVAYIVKWRTADGKHRTKGGFRTRKAAQTYATEVAHATQRGNTFDPKAGTITFRQQAELWLNSRHDLKPTTSQGYRYALAQKRATAAHALSINNTFGGYPLNKITRDQISTWVAALASNNYKPATIRAYMQIVRQVLAQAVTDNKIAYNPATHVRLPGNNKSTTAVVDDPSQFLTAAQVQTLQNTTPWPYNILVHLAAWSGLRAGELCGLTIADVVLPLPNSAKPALVNVERTLVLLNGGLTYQAPKTQGSRRRVPLPAATTALLREYLQQHPRNTEPTAPLFPGLVARGPIEPVWANPLQHTAFYRRVFKPARAQAGLPPALVFHSLRHTYVSLCIAAGIPPLEISRFAGHSSVTTTLGVYAHLFESDHAEAMTALGGMNTCEDKLATPTTSNVVPLRAVGMA